MRVIKREWETRRGVDTGRGRKRIKTNRTGEGTSENGWKRGVERERGRKRREKGRKGRSKRMIKTNRQSDRSKGR